MVVLIPAPAIAPGLIIQFPTGKPFKTTLPVATAQDGCMIIPIVGTKGVAGWALMIISADATEVHPSAFVTVKLYVPATSPDMVVLIPAPAIAPGLIIQFPAGKPLKTTLPVATAQDGCVIIPIVGTKGVAGCALMITSADAAEVHTSEFVTV